MFFVYSCLNSAGTDEYDFYVYPDFFYKREVLPTVLWLVYNIYGMKRVGWKGQPCIQTLLLLLALISYSVQAISNVRLSSISFIYEHTQCL